MLQAPPVAPCRSRVHRRGLLRASCRPFDQRWANRGAHRVALVVRQTETTNQKAVVHGTGDDLRRDTVEPQLRSTEQLEVLGVVHSSPREVDEPSTRRTVDVRTFEIEPIGGGDGLTFDGPRSRSCTARRQSKQFVSAIPSLNCDMDVVVSARRVRAGRTAEPGQIDTIDLDQHCFSMGVVGGCPHAAQRAARAPRPHLSLRSRQQDSHAGDRGIRLYAEPSIGFIPTGLAARKRWLLHLTTNISTTTTSTAKGAAMSRFRTTVTSIMCTTDICIDRTTITTTNASPPASTPCMRDTTMLTATGAGMWPSRMAITSTTFTMGAGTPLTASTTTSTDADRNGWHPTRRKLGR